MGDFVPALWTTLLGMMMVFLTLGLMMLIIAGLQYVFREPSTPAVTRTMAMEVPLPSVVDRDGNGARQEVVAAIAVALAVLRERQSAPPPPETTVLTLSPGTSAWRVLGRLS